ncbi:hypothetical protein JWJ88_03785 [Paracoccus methylovorus]|uniref:Uncharacterized protein n=1 Tax=Paracoccus methylovorus TaxID=2812658 RepID=A0ABX7JLF9_9RHOB|nr:MULTISPECIES: hypothetical protein [Paracoccus]QRZ13794.1 hypothetical protein JWJ88_03785 [Paracoccus methylovorus]
MSRAALPDGRSKESPARRDGIRVVRVAAKADHEIGGGHDQNGRMAD